MPGLACPTFVILKLRLQRNPRCGPVSVAGDPAGGVIRFALPSSVIDQMSADAACAGTFDVSLNAAVPEGFRSNGHADMAQIDPAQRCVRGTGGACTATARAGPESGPRVDGCAGVRSGLPDWRVPRLPACRPRPCSSLFSACG